MNLTHDAWIPVIGSDGGSRLVSLLQIYAEAHSIRDFSAKPHEKIALLRLLICIAQAALDGPEDYSALGRCQSEIQPAVERYLGQWSGALELFGGQVRFLQVSGLKPAKEDGAGNPATKLDLTLASGNTSFIFDNAAAEERAVPPARLALTLLTFQCFSPGGRIGVAKWNGAETRGAGSSNHAPCIPSGMLHTFVQGKTLLATLHRNLLTREQVDDVYGPKGWGQPVWERAVTGLDDSEGIENATRTYLGRLVPLSRAVSLEADGRRMILANGLDYAPYPVFREPAATLVSRKDGVGILGVDLGRSVWRQLAAITVKRRSSADPISGPLALSNLDGSEAVTLWIGALATARGKAAKIEDLVEAAYDVPAGMFRDAGRKLYEAGVALAEAWSSAVSKAVKQYASTLMMEPPPYVRGRHHFWTTVEQSVPVLLRLAARPEEAGDLGHSEWGRVLRAAAIGAYEFACARQTPRQIEAFARGRQSLSLPKPKAEPGVTEASASATAIAP